MENIHKRRSEEAIGRAIRAVEALDQSIRHGEHPSEKDQRDRFFRLLDRSSERIFAGVEAAAKRGEREFFLGTVSGFKEDCDEIFQLGLGFFKRGLLDEWLHARDLRHVFRGDGSAIAW